MKRSKFKRADLQNQKYTKLLAWVALQTILLVSCQLLENKATQFAINKVADTETDYDSKRNLKRISYLDSIKNKINIINFNYNN